MLSNQKGFTLVELLIVITVVSIMAASVISITNPTRWFKEARDSKRKEIVHNIATAMNLCYTANQGVYDGASKDNCVNLTELNTKGYLKIDYSSYTIPGETAGHLNEWTVAKTADGNNACVSVKLEYPVGSNAYWKYTTINDKTESAAGGC